MTDRQVVHAPGCPADHDCERNHPGASIYHQPKDCTCGGRSAGEEIASLKRRVSDLERAVGMLIFAGGTSKLPDWLLDGEPLRLVFTSRLEFTHGYSPGPVVTLRVEPLSVEGRAERGRP